MNVLSGISVAGLPLKNRLVMPAMNSELATPEGEVTEELIRHHVARGRRLGIVVVGHAYIHASGRLTRRQLGANDDRLVPGLRRLAAAVHESGTAVALQIDHAGMRADASLIGGEPVGPTAAVGSRQIGNQEIEDLVEAFGLAARRAVESGFDAVEVHGAHGYLLCQFASGVTNMRTDEYGGDLKSRMRFPLEVVRRVRVELGSKYQLWYRIGADDRVPGGNTTTEGAEMARMLADAGAQVLDVSGGLCGSRPEGVAGAGYFAYAARAVKDATGLPVVAVGGIATVEEAEAVLSRWNVDLVAVGRAVFHDALWGEKAWTISTRSRTHLGRLRRIRAAIGRLLRRGLASMSCWWRREHG